MVADGPFPRGFEELSRCGSRTDGRRRNAVRRNARQQVHLAAVRAQRPSRNSSSRHRSLSQNDASLSTRLRISGQR